MEELEIKPKINPNKKRNRKKHKKIVVDNYAPKGDANALNIPLDNLELKVETLEALKRGGVSRCYDLCVKTERDMFKIQNIGRKQCNEVLAKLKALNLNYRPEESVIEAKPQDERSGERNFNQNNNNFSNNKFNNKNQQNRSANNFNKQLNRNINSNNEPRFKSLKNGGLGVRIKPKFVPIVAPQRENDDIVKFSRNGKWGLMDKKGIEKVPPIYSEVYAFHDGFACVEKDDVFGYVDVNGNVGIDLIYDCAMSFSEGLACVTVNGKCGYINTSGETVVECDFDAGTAFIGGEAKVKQNGKWGTISKNENGLYTVVWIK